ncbi:hypothetical protein IE81DRAFT_43331 [Ceraceosorus guamensis]|uniref:Uncharacterized protein n=1 Tax=Ceraceosorus guamensis TaxID=1522189 RepID=A0A316VPC3_9BASI|nr:hypothetical protein IE81DRAFT_43331 [Ceraceosorus guamensis]PWN39164.1 hypothetical protein IE81DRAFT_43331 [Ceraceosorus guamensis]
MRNCSILAVEGRGDIRAQSRARIQGHVNCTDLVHQSASETQESSRLAHPALSRSPSLPGPEQDWLEAPEHAECFIDPPSQTKCHCHSDLVTSLPRPRLSPLVAMLLFHLLFAMCGLLSRLVGAQVSLSNHRRQDAFSCEATVGPPTCPDGAPVQQKPSSESTPNGCGDAHHELLTTFLNAVVPHFVDACNQHDVCYGECGSLILGPQN